MGANFRQAELPGTLTPAQIRQTFKQMSADAAYNSGHSYSGDWNMIEGMEVVENREFSSLEEAHEFVADNTHKWENGLAVRFKDVRKVFVSPPTFAGKPYQGSEDRPCLLVELDYNRREMPIKKITPADQLSPEDAKKLTELYSVARELRIERETLIRKGNATKEQFSLANEKAEAARTEYDTLKAKLQARLWETKEVPYTGWFMGGWAAE